MKINITNDHLKLWAKKPPEKRMVISDLGISRFQTWREPSGRISFRLRYVSPVTGKRQSYTIGTYPALSLKEAQAKAIELSILVDRGEDPKLERDGVTSELTLKQLLIQMLTAEGDLFRRSKGVEGIAPRTVSDYKRYLDIHYGDLADIPVVYLQKHPHVILNHISLIRSKGTVNTSRLVKASMSSAFSWGIQSGLLATPINPCIAQFRVRRKKASSKTIKRYMSIDEVKHLLISLDNEVKGKTVSTKRKQTMTAGMLRLMLYTGVRPNEAAGAFRDEFELSAGLWTLPGFRPYKWNDEEHIRRTKNGTDHTLPLSTQAVQFVQNLMDVSSYSPWLFPVRKFTGIPKTPHMQPPKHMLERIFKDFPGDNITPHSIRRTVGTQLVELGFSDASLVGRILNHTPQDVTGKHYVGAKEMDKIRTALQSWADYLDRLKAGHEDKVVSISGFKKSIAS